MHLGKWTLKIVEEPLLVRWYVFFDDCMTTSGERTPPFDNNLFPQTL